MVTQTDFRNALEGWGKSTKFFFRRIYFYFLLSCHFCYSPSSLSTTLFLCQSHGQQLNHKLVIRRTDLSYNTNFFYQRFLFSFCCNGFDTIIRPWKSKFDYLKAISISRKQLLVSVDFTGNCVFCGRTEARTNSKKNRLSLIFKTFSVYSSLVFLLDKITKCKRLQMLRYLNLLRELNNKFRKM